MKAKTHISTIALALFLAGCASSGVQVSQEAAFQFTEKKSTEADIVGKLGRPTMTTIDSGMKTLTYSGSQVKIKAASFIPIVGTFAGGTDVQTTAAAYQIDMKTGILQKIIYSNADSSAQAGSQPAPSGDTSPRYVK